MGDDGVWLALSTRTGRLPVESEVEQARRRHQLGEPRPEPGHVEVLEGQVLVDVHDLSPFGAALVAAWPEGTPVIWTADGTTLTRPGGGVVVPWRCRYVQPEPVLDPARNARVAAMLRCGAVQGSFVGMGCGPLVSAEGVPGAVSDGFATWLASAAHAERLAATSAAAAQELEGWRSMLTGTGLTGPEIRAVLVGDPALSPSGPEVDIHVAGVPATGSNHLTALAATEMLWGEGMSFGVGVDAGGPARIVAEVARLIAAGHPLVVLHDEVPTARVTVYPPSSDALAVPVARSVARGVPVVCAGHGTMAEVGGSGVVPVDTRDDEALARVLRDLLTDDALLLEAMAGATARRERPWGDYAAEAWAYLTGGSAAGPRA